MGASHLCICFFYIDTRTCIYMYNSTHTCIYMQTAYTHAPTCKQHTHMHLHANSIHTHASTCKQHTHTCTYMQTAHNTCIYMQTAHTHASTCTLLYMCTCLHYMYTKNFFSLTFIPITVSSVPKMSVRLSARCLRLVPILVPSANTSSCILRSSIVFFFSSIQRGSSNPVCVCVCVCVCACVCMCVCASSSTNYNENLCACFTRVCMIFCVQVHTVVRG